MSRRKRFLFGGLAIILILLYAAITADMISINNDTMNNRSNIESLSEEELRSSINDLSDAARRWRTIKLVVLIIAAILGGIVLMLEVFEDSDNDARDLAEARLSSLEERADDLAIAQAHARASEANARAEEAEAKVASADAASQDAVARVVDAEVRIAEANRGAAEANAIAETERVARLRFEARQQPRTLTVEQQNKVIERLSPFGKVAANLAIFGDTHEIQTIAGIILSCLQRVGWKVGINKVIGGGGNVTGIIVGVRMDADGDARTAAATLISDLRSFGISATPWGFDEMGSPGTSLSSGEHTPNAPVKIFVGAKP